MTFKANANGELSLVGSKSNRVNQIPYNVESKKSIFSKLSENLKPTKLYSITPIPLALATTGATGVGDVGIFWDAFMNYIFPYMMDIAKVFCAIKIAQAFYQEKRGGRDEGSGIGAFVTYGKWYILFALMPWAVELLDQLGGKMLMDLRGNGLE